MMLKRRETYRVNKIGPKKLPCATPQFRLKSSENAIKNSTSNAKRTL